MDHNLGVRLGSPSAAPARVGSDMGRKYAIPNACMEMAKGGAVTQQRGLLVRQQFGVCPMVGRERVEMGSINPHPWPGEKGKSAGGVLRGVALRIETGTPQMNSAADS